MSVAKNLPVYHLIQAASMSSVITSIPTNIKILDDVGIQLNWTGTPTGTFDVQISADYDQVPGVNGKVINAGHWISLTLNPAITASGSADNAYIDIYGISAPWIRVVYTPSSGSGTLDGYIVAKAI